MLFLRLLAHLLSLTGTNGVGIILVDAHGRFLLNLRVPDPEVELPGRWAILAGAIEPGETPDQTAAREIEEEIGHPLPLLHPVVRVTWPRPVHLFAAGVSVPADQLLLGEGLEHRFVTLDEVNTLSPRAPLLRSVLRAFAGTPFYRVCVQDATQT